MLTHTRVYLEPLLRGEGLCCQFADWSLTHWWMAPDSCGCCLGCCLEQTGQGTAAFRSLYFKGSPAFLDMCHPFGALWCPLVQCTQSACQLRRQLLKCIFLPRHLLPGYPEVWMPYGQGHGKQRDLPRALIDEPKYLLSP